MALKWIFTIRVTLEKSADNLTNPFHLAKKQLKSGHKNSITMNQGDPHDCRRCKNTRE